MEESIARGKRILELSNKLWEMPEHKLYRDLKGFDLSLEIFHKNYVMLNTLLLFFTADPRSDHLYTVKNHHKFIEIGKDVVQHLHNYVASAQSLIDHSRRLYRNLYQSTNRFPEYQPKVNTEFAQDPLAQFVICLRQYCQHYKAPSIQVRTTFPNGLDGRPLRRVRISRDNLLTFDGWNKGAKEYLKTVVDAVDVQELATLYHDKVIAFHQWVQEKQSEIHKEELRRFRAKEAEVLLLQLENNIENHFSYGKQNPLMKKDDVFLHVLMAEELDQLEQDSLSPKEQAQLAVKLFEEKVEISLPQELKEKISLLYER